ncbi:hypothetical protein ABG768_005199 [Culter alburnus]|uniref:Uncharacterized protein n=1 Tax=Culter alburnus TaxID=194366 RepID=A0AAW1ZT18_CULAL
MPSLPFLNIFGRQLTQLRIATSVPMTFSLVGLQAIIDVKFSCPCKAYWNIAISAFIFIVPALFAFVIMFALLKPFQYKRSSQKQNNSETSQGKDSKETSQGKDNSETSQGKDSKETSQGKDSKETSQGKDNSETSQGKDSKETSQGKDSKETSQGKDNSETSQGKDSKETSQGKDSKETSQGKDNSETSQGKDSKETSQGKDSKETSQGKVNSESSQGKDNSESSQKIAYLVCLIPSLVWICLFFIDGDYIACGFTTCNGRYACDTELHPNCFNWCKPTELSPEKNETECYKSTWQLIYISKIVGYCAAIFFCIIAIYLVKSKTSEMKTKDVASPTVIQTNDTESADEAARLLSDTPAETKTITKGEASPTISEMSNIIERVPEEAS